MKLNASKTETMVKHSASQVNPINSGWNSAEGLC